MSLRCLSGDGSEELVEDANKISLEGIQYVSVFVRGRSVLV